MTKKDALITLIAVVLITAMGSYTWWNYHRHKMLARDSSGIEAVLQMAGKNRKELVKVLKHYGKDPSDSLKLRAAEFLIVNMPGKYSEYYDAPWNDVATVNLRWSSSSDKQLVLDTYKLGELIIEDDVTHITAKYLISNIELSFKVWQEMPWGKSIPFDVFCELILPHRIGNEPLENWREKVLASFADIYNSFREDTTITAVEACSKVNDLLPRFKMDRDFHSMSYSQLMTSARGLCDDMSKLAIFAMRGLGIPVSYDFTPKRLFSSKGTSWNSVRDSDGRYHIFMGAQTNPGKPFDGVNSKTVRTYRKFYGRQQNITLNKEDIPPLLHNFENIVDVTSELGGFDICFPVSEDFSTGKGPVYLAVLNEMEWHPIALGTVTPYSIEFSSLLNGLYLPVYYKNGIQTPAGYPFRLQNDTCHDYQPSSLYARSFTRIAPEGIGWYDIMKGGKFEVASRSDFSDARTIHTIEKTGLGYFTVPVRQESAYRYIRYVSPPDSSCNVSELEFYGENDVKLQGTAIGSPGINATTTHANVFDGDVDTFLKTEETEFESSWVGLDLGEPRRITKIRYLPRTDGNDIYEGHVYEFFYWTGKKWQSLGSEKAESNILRYSVPDRALLYIKNVTKNRMHNTPFVVESGTLEWFQDN